MENIINFLYSKFTVHRAILPSFNTFKLFHLILNSPKHGCCFLSKTLTRKFAQFEFYPLIMMMKSQLRGENEMEQIFPCIQKLKLKPLVAEPGQ